MKKNKKNAEKIEESGEFVDEEVFLEEDDLLKLSNLTMKLNMRKLETNNIEKDVANKKLNIQVLELQKKNKELEVSSMMQQVKHNKEKFKNDLEIYNEYVSELTKKYDLITKDWGYDENSGQIVRQQ